MTVRVTFHQTCDRCESPFVEKQLKAGDKVPTLKSKGIAVYSTETVDGTAVQASKPKIHYDDLCEKCSGVVAKALTSLEAPGAKPKKSKAAKSVAPKSVAPESEAPEAVVTASESVSPEALPEASAVSPSEPPKKKRGRPSKADIAAREEAAKAAKAEVEAGSESDTPEGEVVDLGLAGDVVSEEAAEDYEGRETFEDPDTGDTIDVHTGEILAKREPELAKAAANEHPF